MRRESSFTVRYLTDETVPIRDIIESLQGVEAIFFEMAKVIPEMVNGVTVQRIEVKAKEIAQESPLKEIFLVALFLAFQKDLEDEVTGNIESITGLHVPDNWDTIITVLALVLVFYGVGAIKDLVFGTSEGGPSRKMLDGLIAELATSLGKTPKDIRDKLDQRYRDRTLWKRLANTTSRFFAPSKKQNSAPMEVNGRSIPQETVQDVPAQYVIDHEVDTKPARSFSGVALELHAQDRDHAGRGWAAIPRGLHGERLRLRLMDDVSTTDLWGHNVIRGDVTIIYERAGTEMVPKEIQLHRVTGVES
jgi:hypothetical protein